MTDGPQNIFTKEQIDEIKDLIKNADKHFVDFSKMENLLCRKTGDGLDLAQRLEFANSVLGSQSIFGL